MTLFVSTRGGIDSPQRDRDLAPAETALHLDSVTTTTEDEILVSSTAFQTLCESGC